MSGTALSRERAKALHKIYHVLEQTKLYMTEKMNKGTTNAPTLRKHTKAYQTNENGQLWNANWLFYCERPMDHVLWLVPCIGQKNCAFHFGHWIVLDEIERIIETDPVQKARLSRWLMDCISDLGIISEIQRQLELLHMEHWSGDDIMTQEERSSAFRAALIDADYSQYDVDTWESLYESQLQHLGCPAKARFHYPSEEERTKEPTDAMRLAESKLDKFWHRVDRDARVVLRKPLHVALDIKHRSVRRTPPWGSKSSSLRGADAELAADRLSALGISGEADNFDKAAAAFVKEKQKTCPADETVPDRLSAKSKHSPDAIDAAAPKEIIKVTQRAVKVFRALLSASGTAAPVKEVSWREFLQAMHSAGFAPEKLDGSVWQFSSSCGDTGRSIHFHEPHPDPKLSLWAARRHGRRLTSAFGWDGETFVHA